MQDLHLILCQQAINQSSTRSYHTRRGRYGASTNTGAGAAHSASGFEAGAIITTQSKKKTADVMRSGMPLSGMASGTLSRTMSSFIAAASVAHFSACESYARSLMTIFDAIVLRKYSQKLNQAVFAFLKSNRYMHERSHETGSSARTVDLTSRNTLFT